MQLGTLLSDDHAVSPVIGVVLMVGITVTMAAVIGVFVLGASTATSPPDAQMRYVADKGTDDTWGNEGGEKLVIEHDGGEDIDLDRVEVQYMGTDVTSGAFPWMTSVEPSGDEWRPGETWTLKDKNAGGDSFAPNQQVLVLWTTPDGASSQILANGDLPG
jgi:flagellin-like protein